MILCFLCVIFSIVCIVVKSHDQCHRMKVEQTLLSFKWHVLILSVLETLETTSSLLFFTFSYDLTGFHDGTCSCSSDLCSIFLFQPGLGLRYNDKDEAVSILWRAVDSIKSVPHGRPPTCNL